MEPELDHKQERLIAAWLQKADDVEGDEYGRFMAAWIAFNALCYARFAKRASKNRPDLRKSGGLQELENPVPIAGTLEPREGQGVRLKIEKPGEIWIDIRERYTEDLVFREFAKSYAPAFKDTWANETSVHRALDSFLDSIRRPKGHYVVNMLKAGQHNETASPKELEAQGVVVAVSAPEDLGQLVAALYQVRCNVFHGEKVPGDVNDDRIVKAARPLLVELINHALG